MEIAWSQSLPHTTAAPRLICGLLQQFGTTKILTATTLDTPTTNNAQFYLVHNKVSCIVVCCITLTVFGVRYVIVCGCLL